MMKAIVINDPVKLRKAMQFAAENGATDRFAQDLVYLLDVLTMHMVESDMDEHGGQVERPGNIVAEVLGDFAPHSLRFAIYRDARCHIQMDRDFAVLLNGGWVYAGPTSPGDGSFPSLSANLSYVMGSLPTHSWSVHT